MKGHKTGGRVRGTPNKVTTLAKEAFAKAFDKLGGVHALTEWGQENKTEFYKLYGRLIPVEQQVSGAIGTYSAQPIPVEEREPVPSVEYAPSNSTARH